MNNNTPGFYHRQELAGLVRRPRAAYGLTAGAAVCRPDVMRQPPQLKRIVFILLPIFFCIARVSAQVHPGELEDACNDSAMSLAFEYGTVLLLTDFNQLSTPFIEHAQMTKTDRILFDSSAAYYEQRQFGRAALLLKEVHFRNPHDLYVLNRRARTTYWINSEKSLSFRLYCELIHELDSLAWLEHINTEDEDTTRPFVPINRSFMEAYWKLATLHLDRQEFDKARRELHRFELALKTFEGDDADPRAYEQLYSYLTEAYYFLKNSRANKFYYCLAKKLNPSNKYVDKYKL